MIPMANASVNGGQSLTLGFSPCPNDTFIFDALVNRSIDTGGLHFDYVMEDVEMLNQMAFKGQLDVTKLSYNTYLQVADKYILLDSGSALGRGVGPLLIQKDISLDGVPDWSLSIDKAKIAIPGVNTTANLLFSMAYPHAQNKEEVLFSEIENRVLDGEFDCGLVIHESRFTYAQRGLHKLMDMGDWWEKTSGAAIPLGGICIRRDMPIAVALQVQQAIKESLQSSWMSYPKLSDFVKKHAQEMDEEVMRKHIDLYVNDFSLSLGSEGRKAVITLFEKAKEFHLIQAMPERIFV